MPPLRGGGRLAAKTGRVRLSFYIHQPTFQTMPSVPERRRTVAELHPYRTRTVTLRNRSSSDRFTLKIFKTNSRSACIRAVRFLLLPVSAPICLRAAVRPSKTLFNHGRSKSNQQRHGVDSECGCVRGANARSDEARPAPWEIRSEYWPPISRNRSTAAGSLSGRLCGRGYSLEIHHKTCCIGGRSIRRSGKERLQCPVARCAGCHQKQHNQHDQAK